MPLKQFATDFDYTLLYEIFLNLENMLIFFCRINKYNVLE